MKSSSKFFSNKSQTVGISTNLKVQGQSPSVSTIHGIRPDIPVPSVLHGVEPELITAEDDLLSEGWCRIPTNSNQH